MRVFLVLAIALVFLVSATSADFAGCKDDCSYYGHCTSEIGCPKGYQLRPSCTCRVQKIGRPYCCIQYYPKKPYYYVGDV